MDAATPQVGASYRLVAEMKPRPLILTGLALLAGVLGYLVWGNLTDNLVYYLTPSEAIEQRADYRPDERFRLGGLVETDSLEETDDGVRFLVGDGAASVTVIHTGAPPQLFREGIGVIVEGAWENNLVHSDVLIINHDEQYRAGSYQMPTAGS